MARVKQGTNGIGGKESIMKIELDLPVPEGFKLANYTHGSVQDNLTIKTLITFERIEPVDTELAKAKKKFPVGSYFKSNRHGDTIFKVKEVIPFGGPGRIIVGADSDNSDIETFGFDVPDCTPFPLPVWRCCEADKPKISCKRAVRRKGNSYAIRVDHFYTTCESWESTSRNGEASHEWLDEGEL